MSDKKIDSYSFALGIIFAFTEVVAADVKQLALSEPATPEMMQQLLPEAQRIAQRFGVSLFLETDLIQTDLFPDDAAGNQHVLLIYRNDDVLARYQALKQERERLTQNNAYAGAPRRQIAAGFGKLLSYSDARIDALIAQQAKHH
jgi:hypothetical protein